MATIAGAHMIVYSADADADRTFLRDVLGFPHVDVGQGWLIFALPASEIAVHPADSNERHEIYLMVNDIAAFVAEMTNRGIGCTPPQDQGWGVLTHLSLPGGGAIGIYEPRHARPTWHEPPRQKMAKPRTSASRSRKAAKGRAAAARKAAKPARRKVAKPARRKVAKPVRRKRARTRR